MEDQNLVKLIEETDHLLDLFNALKSANADDDLTRKNLDARLNITMKKIQIKFAHIYLLKPEFKDTLVSPSID